jgi:DnaK suppressor protein
MSKSIVNQLRMALEARVMEFDSSARQRESIFIEEGGDEADRTRGAADREFAVRSLEAGSTKLREARAALKRMDEGKYGICLECEEAISPLRLAALPWAPLCLRCQAAIDGDCGSKYGRPALPLAA